MDDASPKRFTLDPPRPLVLLHVASVLLPLALVVLGTKLHRYVMALNPAQDDLKVPFSIGDMLGVIGPDMLVLMGYAVVWTGILSALPSYEIWSQTKDDLPTAWWKRGKLWLKERPFAALVSGLTITSFHLVTLAFILLSVMEHGYFLIQHLPADGGMLVYALNNFEMLQPVLESKMTTGLWIAIWSISIFAIHPFLLRRLSWVQARVGSTLTWREWTQGSHRRMNMGIGAWLLAGLIFTNITVDENIEPLQANGGWTLVSEMLAWSAEDYGDLDAVDLGDQLKFLPTEDTKRHNVVLIVLESTRAKSIGLYGSNHNTMPYLESLAKKGRWAKQAYTTVPHTSKALVSIHCGAYPKIVTPIEEAQNGALPDGCIAKVLKEQGYATAFFQPAQEGFERRHTLVRNFGFDMFQGKESLPNKSKFHESSYFGYEDNIMIEPSLKWVDQQKEPFFLSYLTLTAHHDYTVPRGFETKKYVDDEEVNKYLNTLAYTDRFVEQVVEGFKKRGLLEKTLFILVGDHGEGFREHGRTEHDNVIYEEGLRVPLVLFGAGVPSDGQAIKGLRQHIDILPTVADALGYKMHGGQSPGISLLNDDGHEELFYSCWYTKFCMAHRQGSKKTIFHYKRRKPQVFDLSDDPDEKNNLARSDGVDSTIIDKLKAWKFKTNQRYEAYLKRRKDRFVTTKPPTPRKLARVKFEDGIEILGYSVSKTQIKAGEAFDLATHFHASSTPSKPWKLFVHVRGPRNKFINADHEPVSGAYPIGEWNAGEYIEDRHAIYIPTSSPPGTYKVMLGLWRKGVKGGDRAARASAESSDVEVDKDRRVHLLEIQVVR